MSIKHNIPEYAQKIIESLNEQILFHEKEIENLKFQVDMWENHAPEQVKLSRLNSPLTRDLIRNFLKGWTEPIQTTSIIDMLYNNIDQEKRNKLIKTLSVMLNQMEKEGEITIEKREGVKGNFYKRVRE